jgi:sulfate-transporting ATPase
MPSDTQVIYSMMRVGRIHPPNKQVLRDISLGFYYGAKIGVLGLNGAGKSTLLRIMAGLDQNYVGEIAQSKGYTVGFLPQDPEKTVIQLIREGVQPIVEMLARYDEVNAKFGEPDADFDALIAEQAKLQDALDKVDAWNLDSHLDVAMDALRCPPADSVIRNLSGGEKRRVALTRLLLTEPDILLLDEPTNHLDAESVAWLEHHLREYKGTVIAVTHDRYFLDNVAGWILELDRGYGIPWKGNYSSWLEQKQERIRLEEKSESKRQKTLERELEWIRMSPKARQSKGQARVTAYESLLSQETEKRREDLEIYLPPGPRLGDVVLELNGVSKSYGERLILDNFTAKIPPGSIATSTLARRSNGPTPTRPARSTRKNPSTRRFRAARRHWNSATAKSTRAATVHRSILWAQTSRRRPACFLAVSATVCIWPRRSRKAPTSSCLTNRPTTWT